MAWAAVRGFYRAKCEVFEKAGEGPATEADRLADRLISEALRRDYPESQYGYLTEESEDELVRLDRRRVWIIDPIDGTKEFIAGSGNFAVQIGLVEIMDDGVWHPVVGVVYRPIPGLMYWAIRGQGTWRCEWPEQEPCAPPLPSPLTAEGLPAPGWARLSVTRRDRISELRSVISNTHRSGRLVRLIQGLNLESYWHIGSLGVKVAIIAEGGAELYINISGGRTKEWDTAGPHLILTEAGGRLTDLSGAPIRYNQRDVYQRNGLIASNSLIHDEVVDLVQQLLKEEERV